MNIAIRLEDGVIKEVTSDSPAAEGAKVAILQNDSAERVVRVKPENLSSVMPAAVARTQCEGIGIACEIAGECLLDLSKTRYEDPSKMTDDVNQVLQVFVANIMKAAA